MRLRTATWLALSAVVLCSSAHLRAADDTPEAAVRKLMLGVSNRNDRLILDSTIPNPDEGILWQIEPGPDPRLPAQLTDADLPPLQRLAIGDKVTLPGGKTLVMTRDHVNENRAQITFTDAPFPFIVVKVGNEWRVDASPLIASRQTGHRIAKETNPQSGKPDDWSLPVKSPALGEEIDVGILRMCPPAGYALLGDQHPPFLWQPAAGNDNSQPLLLVNMGQAEAAAVPSSLERELDDVIRIAIEGRRTDFTRTPIERGQIAGIDFVRSRWKGTSKPTDKFPARPMQGIVYYAKLNNTQVLALAQDMVPQSEQSLKIMEDAIRTLRRK